MSRSLCAGGDLSLTATALAWPDRTVLTHGRTGLANPRTPLQERGAAMMGLVWELGSLIGCRALGSDLDPLPTTLTGPEWPALVLLEDFPPGNTRIDPERGYVWWSLVNLLGRYGVPVLPVPPSTVKLYACGMGNANKREVIAGVKEWFPDFEIRRTGKNGRVLTTDDDNKADAVALVALGCDLLGAPLAEVPSKHRRALDTLELPPGVRLAT